MYTLIVQLLQKAASYIIKIKTIFFVKIILSSVRGIPRIRVGWCCTILFMMLNRYVARIR